MLERATWGSGQIARPGYPSRHPGGEFSWAHDLFDTITKLLERLETRAKQVIDRLGPGRLIAVPAKISPLRARRH